jgi:4-hydroxy-4-methyl-2-oxoglutarate aldolase
MTPVVVRNLPRVAPDIVTELKDHGVATVHEAMGRLGLMKNYMRPIYAGARAAGNAVTVLAQPGDKWMLHVAIEQVRPGDMLVVAVSADNIDGMFGELFATSLKARGGVDLVIDAGCRDVRTHADRDGLSGMVTRHFGNGHRQGYAWLDQHPRRVRGRCSHARRCDRRGR